MKRSIPILIFMLFCLISQSLWAQQIFPVRANGSWLPPYSFLLSDYAQDKSQDLMFTVMLNDPIEVSRDVRFRLTIENDGREIMVTNPNFLPQPMTLHQFTPELITGAELAEYLQVQNLVGARGRNSSNFLPEGFNRICLEVIDYQRGVPISSKACVSGFFRPIEAPILEIPTCHKIIPPSPTQNMLFRWLPRHIGLPNAPAVVEYEFTLVELLPGIGDPNDGFDHAIQIYQTTTMVPSLLYMEGEPLLEKNKTYAWRVQAKDMMGGSVFVNNGFSKVCTFSMEEQKVDRDIVETCEVTKTTAEPVSNTPFQGQLVSGDELKLGFFDLVINEATSSGEAYSGKGMVYVPFLKAQVGVDFTDIKVNGNQQVFEVGTVRAGFEKVPNVNELDLSAARLGNTFTADFLNELDYYLSEDANQNRFVSVRNESDQRPVNLPLVMDKVGDNQSPAIILMDMKFTEKEAILTALSLTTQPDKDDLVQFSGKSIKFTPFGIAKNGVLKLEEDIFIKKDNGDHLRFLAYGKNATTLHLNCEGFKHYQIGGEYTFSRNNLLPKRKNNGQVVVDFSAESEDIYDFIATTTAIPGFQLPNLPDYILSAEKGLFDYSISSNSDYALPNNYKKSITVEWKGFQFENPAIQFPKTWTISEDISIRELKGGSLMIEEEGVWTNLSQTNLLTFDKGRINDWPFSIDVLSMNIGESELEDSQLKGKVKVPIIDEPFAYEGAVDLGADGNNFGLNIKPDLPKGGMSLWKADLDYGTESIVKAIGRKLGDKSKLIPYAKFGGQLNMAVSTTEFRNYLVGDKEAQISAIKKALEIENDLGLNIQKLPLKGLTVDPLAAIADRYKLESIDFDKAKIQLGDKTFPVTAMMLQYQPKTTQKPEELGLKIVVVKGKHQVNITLWARKDTPQSFVLNRIETSMEFYDCDCVYHDQLLKRKWDIFKPNLATDWYHSATASLDNGFYENSELTPAADPTFKFENNVLTFQLNKFNLKLRAKQSGSTIKADGGIYEIETKGAIKIPKINKTNRTLWNNAPKIGEASKTYNLPLDLTEGDKPKILLNKFVDNSKLDFPSNTKLILAGIEVASDKKSAIATIILISEGKTFGNANVKFTPGTVEFSKGIHLFLLEDDYTIGSDITKVNLSELEKLREKQKDKGLLTSAEEAKLKELEDKLWGSKIKGKFPFVYKKALTEDKTKGSFAKIDCNGFLDFNVQAEYYGTWGFKEINAGDGSGDKCKNIVAPTKIKMTRKSISMSLNQIAWLNKGTIKGILEDSRNQNLSTKEKANLLKQALPGTLGKEGSSFSKLSDQEIVSKLSNPSGCIPPLYKRFILPFTIDGRSLKSFKGPINTKKWDLQPFAIQDFEPVLFHIKKGYVDYSFTSGGSSGGKFIGIHFEELDIQPIGFHQESSGKREILKIPVKNFTFHHAWGLSGDANLKKVVTKGDVGGWAFTIDKFDLNIKNNKVTIPVVKRLQTGKILTNGGVALEGTILIPIVEDKADMYMKYKAALGFNEESSSPMAMLRIEESQQGKWFDLRAWEFQMQMGTTVETPTAAITLEMNESGDDYFNASEYEPYAVMSGVFRINYKGSDPVKKTISSSSSSASGQTKSGNVSASGSINTKETSISFDKSTFKPVFGLPSLSFQNLKINDPSIYSDCTAAGSSERGLRTMHVDYFSLAAGYNNATGGAKQTAAADLSNQFIQQLPIVLRDINLTCTMEEREVKGKKIKELGYKLDFELEVDLIKSGKNTAKYAGGTKKFVQSRITGKSTPNRARSNALKGGNRSVNNPNPQPGGGRKRSNAERGKSSSMRKYSKSQVKNRSTELKGVCQLAIYIGKDEANQVQGKPADWKFRGVGLDALLIDAQWKMFDVKGGGVAIQGDQTYGSGFKAYADLFFGKDGAAGIGIKAVFQTGKTDFDATAGKKNPDKKFRYFYFDIEAFSNVGLFPVEPVFQTIWFHGGGGGIHYNMEFEDPEPSAGGFSQRKKNKGARVVGEVNYDSGILSPESDPYGYLQPGKSLSGFNYKPRPGSGGFYITGIFSLMNNPILAWGDINIGGSFNSSSGIGKLIASGNIYLLSASPGGLGRIGDPSAAAGVGSATINWNVEHGFLEANASIDFNYPTGSSAAKNEPDNSQKVGSKEVSIFNLHASGEAHALFIFKDLKEGMSKALTKGGQWHVKVGTPKKGVGMSFSFAGITLAEMNAYAQIGHDLDPMLPLSELIPEWDKEDATKKRPAYVDFPGGNGLAFGAHFKLPDNIFEFLMFRARLAAGMGFDISLLKYDDAFVKTLDCIDSGGEFGLNNWYGRGQAYGYFKGTLDMHINLLFYDAWFNIFDVYAAIALQAELPNPVWMRGLVKGRFSVLNGLVEGEAKFKVEVGKRCNIASNPVASIPVIEEIKPNDGADAVPTFVNPAASFTMPVEQVLTLEEIYEENDEIKTRIRTFKPYVKKFDLIKMSDKSVISGLSKMAPDNYSMTYAKERRLEPFQKYIATIQVGWKEYKNGGWHNFIYQNEEYIEEKDTEFTTGDLPDEILEGMLAYHAPGNGQRYWHKGYAKPQLLFQENGWEYLFPRNVGELKSTLQQGASRIDAQSSGNQKFNKKALKLNEIQALPNNIPFDYYILLTEFDPVSGNPSRNLKVRLNEFPNKNRKATLVEPVIKYKQLSNMNYQLPYVAQENKSGIVIAFDKLEELDLKKGYLYKLKVVREPNTAVARATVNESEDYKSFAQKKVAELKKKGTNASDAEKQYLKQLEAYLKDNQSGSKGQPKQEFGVYASESIKKLEQQIAQLTAKISPLNRAEQQLLALTKQISAAETQIKTSETAIKAENAKSLALIEKDKKAKNKDKNAPAKLNSQIKTIEAEIAKLEKAKTDQQKIIANANKKIADLKKSNPELARLADFKKAKQEAVQQRRQLQQAAQSASSSKKQEEGGVTLKRKVTRLTNASDQFSPLFKTLYDYHFGLSEFDHLHQKLIRKSISNYEKGKIKKKYDHPDEKAIQTFGNKTQMADIYYGVKDGEALDEYDIIKMTKNLKISVPFVEGSFINRRNKGAHPYEADLYVNGIKKVPKTPFSKGARVIMVDNKVDFSNFNSRDKLPKLFNNFSADGKNSYTGEAWYLFSEKIMKPYYRVKKDELNPNGWAFHLRFNKGLRKRITKEEIQKGKIENYKVSGAIDGLNNQSTYLFAFEDSRERILQTQFDLAKSVTTYASIFPRFLEKFFNSTSLSKLYKPYIPTLSYFDFKSNIYEHYDFSSGKQTKKSLSNSGEVVWDFPKLNRWQKYSEVISGSTKKSNGVIQFKLPISPFGTQAKKSIEDPKESKKYIAKTTGGNLSICYPHYNTRLNRVAVYDESGKKLLYYWDKKENEEHLYTHGGGGQIDITINYLPSDKNSCDAILNRFSRGVVHADFDSGYYTRKLDGSKTEYDLTRYRGRDRMKDYSLFQLRYNKEKDEFTIKDNNQSIFELSLYDANGFRIYQIGTVNGLSRELIYRQGLIESNTSYKGANRALKLPGMKPGTTYTLYLKNRKGKTLKRILDKNTFWKNYNLAFFPEKIQGNADYSCQFSIPTANPKDYALKFDRSWGNVIRTENLRLSNKHFSLETVVKPTTQTGSLISGNQQGGCALFLTSQGVNFKYNNQTCMGAIAMKAGQAYHILATYENKTLRIIVDGIEITNKTINPPSTKKSFSNPATFYFGQNYIGDIDYIKIYDQAKQACDYQLRGKVKNEGLNFIL